MRYRWAELYAVGVTMALMGCGDLDTPDYVHDLRMLAVRLDPPDQPLVPSRLQTAQSAQSTASVQLTALVADPSGAGRQIVYTLATCARLDTDNRNCTTASLGYKLITEGVTTAPEGYTELALAFAADDALLGQALAQDPYHGTQGLWLPLQLSLQAGQETVTGTKLVVYTLTESPTTYVANQNPNLLGLKIGDALWDEAAPFVFHTGAVPKDGYVISPVFNAEDQEHFVQTTFTGAQRPSQESFMVDYFCTWGGMTPTSAGGSNPFVARATALPASAFTPPKGAALGTGLFWFVMRDGRGGTDWRVRPAELAL